MVDPDVLLCLQRAREVLATWHHALLNNPKTWNFHKHALGTASDFPGFSCKGCETVAAIDLVLKREWEPVDELD